MSFKCEVDNLKLHKVLTEIIGTWDLEKATAASVRRHLEDYGADLSAPNRSIIKEEVNMFFEEGEDDDNEGKCTRTRKRKRKDSERCIVSPQLQEIVGEGPEMARAKAVKKVVVYGRKKGGGLQQRCFIYTDDKLKALFPGQSAIHIFQISKYLSLNGHIQPLIKDAKLCIECKVRMRRTRRKIKTCECDHTDHSQRKDMQQNRNLLPREDVRSWDTLPQDMLVKILDCCLGPQKCWGYNSPAATTDYASVSRSWTLAVLELVFPPTNGDVLDLTMLDSHPWKSRHKMFFHYLMIVLNCRPASTWTTLYFPHETRFAERPCRQKNPYRQKNIIVIKNDILPLIAEKTPELQNLILPTELVDKIFGKLAPFWKNLTKVHMYTSAYNLNVLHSNCKFICELSLYGRRLDENTASILGKSFPNIKSLVIENGEAVRHCNVLRLILDGHKNLQLLELLEAQQYVYRFAETDHVESSSEP